MGESVPARQNKSVQRSGLVKKRVLLFFIFENWPRGKLIFIQLISSQFSNRSYKRDIFNVLTDKLYWNLLSQNSKTIWQIISFNKKIFDLKNCGTKNSFLLIKLANFWGNFTTQKVYFYANHGKAKTIKTKQNTDDSNQCQALAHPNPNPKFVVGALLLLVVPMISWLIKRIFFTFTVGPPAWRSGGKGDFPGTVSIRSLSWNIY